VSSTIEVATWFIAEVSGIGATALWRERSCAKATFAS